jgi:hypothetical protein
MKVKFKAKPTPHLLLTDVFSEDQLDEVCREIFCLHPSLKPARLTGSAGVEAMPRKRNSGLFIHETYADVAISRVWTQSVRQLASRDVSAAWKPAWLSDLYESTLDRAVLISHYGDEDCYLPHRDSSLFTGLIWLWDEPKPFSGGEFTLTDYDYEIDCKANSGIVFLSHEQHAVAPVKGEGRYTISVFMGKPV